MFRPMERTYGNTERQHIISISSCAIGVVRRNRHNTRRGGDSARAVSRIWSSGQCAGRRAEHCTKCNAEQHAFESASSSNRNINFCQGRCGRWCGKDRGFISIRIGTDANG